MIGIRTGKQDNISQRLAGLGKPASPAIRLPRLTAGRIMLLAFLGGLAVQALLLGRLALQLADRNVESGLARLVYDASNVLIAPFSGFESSAMIKDTGILQTATLVAMDFYLIVTLAIIIGTFWLSQSFAFAKRLRSREHWRREVVLNAPAPGQPAVRGGLVAVEPKPQRPHGRRQVVVVVPQAPRQRPVSGSLVAIETQKVDR